MRLIDADELKKAIQKLEEEPNYQHEGETWQNGLYMAENLIDNAPTVEYPFYAEAYQTGYEEAKNERPQGEWEYVGMSSLGLQIARCKKCNEKAYGMTDYCPNCGAKMERSAEE